MYVYVCLLLRVSVVSVSIPFGSCFTFLVCFCLSMCYRCETASDEDVAKFCLPFFDSIVRYAVVPPSRLSRIVSAMCVALSVSSSLTWKTMRTLLHGKPSHNAMAALLAILGEEIMTTVYFRCVLCSDDESN